MPATYQPYVANRVCVDCKTKYAARGRPRLDGRCASCARAFVKRTATPQRKCRQCGTPFTPDFHHRSYCGDECQRKGNHGKQPSSVPVGGCVVRDSANREYAVVYEAYSAISGPGPVLSSGHETADEARAAAVRLAAKGYMDVRVEHWPAKGPESIVETFQASPVNHQQKGGG